MDKKFLAVAATLFAVFGFVFFSAVWNRAWVKAGAEHNVSGFAWSENIGWISFNNTSGGGAINYGVDIDAGGIFSGYAWSENIGWISFNRSDAGAPPASPDYGTYLAKVDLATKEVSGWARALANGAGWDGWIKLRGTNYYGILLDDAVNPAEFRNWAWSDMVVGWISFNCADRGICGLSNYKVITGFVVNHPPCVSCGLRGGESGGPVIEYQTYCGISGQGQIGFRGVYQDENNDLETRFDFRVNDVNDVNDPNPEIDRSFPDPDDPYAPPLNYPSGTVNTQSVFVKSAWEKDVAIQFNKTYWWWMKVYDSKGTDSGWVAGPSSFTTPSHASPWVDFDWSPLRPNMNEQTSFEDTSTLYKSGGQIDTGGQRTNDWTFQDGSPGNSSSQNPSVKFTSFGQKQITLKVTDSEGSSCSASKTLDIQIPLPDWKEILPF